MKKLIFTFLSLLCLVTISFSQSVDVEWGPEQKKVKTSYVSGVITNDSKGYYILRIKSGGMFSHTKYYIERYTTDNVLEFSKEFQVENQQKKDCDFESIRFLKDRFVLFMSYYDSKTDKNILYAQEFDKEGNSMGAAEEIDFIVSKKKKNNGDFNVIVSDDQSKVLVYHNEPYEKNKNEKFSYKVFDNSMKNIWQKDIELTEKDKDVSIKDYKIDNEGYVYAISSVGKELKVSGLFTKNKTLYTYKIITYDYKKNKQDEIVLTLAGSKYITQVNFELDEAKGKIIVTGFYALKEKAGLAGTIFTRIDKKTFKVEYETSSAFDKQFLLNVYKNTLSDKKAKKQEDVSGNFSIDHIIIKEDGGIILVAEEYFVHVVTTTSTSGGVTTTRTTYYYYYRNIIAINLNPDGTIMWSTVVPKLQLTVNDGGPYSSYIMTYNQGKLYFWYNDNPKNTAPKTKPDNRGKYYMNNPKKAMVVMATVDQKGEVTQEAFFKSKNDSKAILKPKMYSLFKPNEILVYAEFSSKYKFGYFRIKTK